ncbi:hypothetical protein OG943_08490 [Amycolatopsis sp. NBC_00345]
MHWDADVVIVGGAAVRGQQLLPDLGRLGRAGVAGELDLHRGALDRQRGAQFVGRVRHEPALAVERRFKAVEHVVEGFGQFGEFVSRAVQREPFVQIGRGQPARGRGDRVQRPERPAGQPPACRHRHRHRHRDHGHRDQRQR